jgi:uncharacterized protein YbjT (DUF2867 family)
MILIAGGTGLLGGAIGARLLDQGRPLRLLVRDPARAAALQRAGAQLAAGDLRDPASLAAACDGVTHVITTANAFMGRGGNTVDAVDRQGNRNLIDAARLAGVRQFVFTSALLPEMFKGEPFFAAKFETEDYLRASGLTWTILQPTAFMDIWAQIIGEPVLKRGATMVFGPGTYPLNFVAIDNVADVAVLTIDNPAAFDRIVEIGGPENLTPNEVVGIFERLAGRPARRRHMPVPVLRALSVLLRPFNAAVARQMAAGAFTGSGPLTFDPAPMLERYPVRLVTLEEWARARYGQQTLSPMPPPETR